MAARILKHRLWIAVLLVLVFSLSSSNAFAWGGGHGGRYHWHGGGWYRDGWFWGGMAVSALVVGAMVASLPPRYNVVYVGSVPYYYDGTYYYQPSSVGGYVVVENPAVVVPAAPVVVPAAPAVVVTAPVQAAVPVESSAVVINVPNANGGYTPVALKKSKDGYTGPQGEFYQGNPTIDQLKVLYGK